MVKTLQPDAKHRPVDLLQQASGDVDHSVRCDAQEVAVICQMVNRAKSDPVDDSRITAGIAVLDDVGRLEERRVSSSDVTPAAVVSAMGKATWNATTSLMGSSRVRNMGAIGVYWPGAMPRK